MTTVDYDLATPAGRAIQHLLDHSRLQDLMDHGIAVTTPRLTLVGRKQEPPTARLLVIHPSIPRSDHLGPDGALLVLAQAYAGVAAVNLDHLHAVVTDPTDREAIAMAAFLAAGYEIDVPAGKRRAS